MRADFKQEGLKKLSILSPRATLAKLYGRSITMSNVSSKSIREKNSTHSRPLNIELSRAKKLKPTKGRSSLASNSEKILRQPPTPMLLRKKKLKKHESQLNELIQSSGAHSEFLIEFRDFMKKYIDHLQDSISEEALESLTQENRLLTDQLRVLQQESNSDNY